ncbi:MAG: hypothetical protein RLY58_2122 [Pseudomonadota bacterium]|jgi:hypothetical protein
MSMRKKPDTRAFSAPKDPNAFLDGGIADRTEIKTTAIESPSTVKQGQPKLTKIFNLSPILVQALKQEAFDRSNREGRRVTETELVDAALRQFLNLSV